MSKYSFKQSLLLLLKTCKSIDKWILIGVVIAIMLSGAALAAITSYAVTYANGMQTIQGALPPPNLTTYVQYNPVTGQQCDNTLKNMAGAQAGVLNSQYQNALNAANQNSLGSCLSGIAGLPLGIPSLNLAGLMQSLENAACQAVNTKITSTISPLYASGNGMMSALNPGAAASGFSIPGTNGAVNLGSAINTQTVNIQSNGSIITTAPPPTTSSSLFR